MELVSPALNAEGGFSRSLGFGRFGWVKEEDVHVGRF